MTTNTPNLNLVTYNNEEDLQRTFQQFLDDLTGITNSNMTKIDDWGGGIEEELDDKSPLDSPTFTGVPTAPTAEVGTDTNQIATTAFVLANSGGNSTLDWRTGTGTWSYVSADSPSFVISIPDSDAESIGLGYKIKLTQTTDKYFIVTLIGTSIAGYTPITVYGGTSFVLTNTTITSPKFSPMLTPIGFPLTRSLWDIYVINNSDYTVTATENNVWANIGGLSIIAPVGQWNISYSFSGSCASNTTNHFYTTMSTGNNSETNNLTTLYFSSNSTTEFFVDCSSNDDISLSAKTTHYINVKKSHTGASTATIKVNGTKRPTKIILKCLYL